ncbi:MAG: hypothetical protein JJT76_14880 [Clostridiaceae bacterium]|nr:hypothetical protein [Clostridiaceae bacterium]
MKINTEKLANGIFLIGIGLLFLLSNVGIINWSIWSAFFRLWPLLLVVAGVNIVLKNKVAVTIISWVLFFSIFMAYGFVMEEKHEIYIEENNELISIEKIEDNKEAQLNLRVGGVKLHLSTVEDHLLRAYVNSNRIEHSLRHENSREKAIIDFESINHATNFIGPSSEHYRFYLNNDVPWDINAKIGAVSGELNFSALKLHHLDLTVGAGDLHLVFGTQFENSTIKIKGGASNINVTIPQDAGARIKITGLVSKSTVSDLGWEKVEDYYYSPNYKDADSKLDFDISIGVGNINLNIN